MRKWEAAAQNYYEAAKFVDLSKIDNSALKIAESHYNHGGFEDAATKYNDIFLNFN